MATRERTEYYVLTNVERWVIRETLKNAPYMFNTSDELVEFLVHECEKNSVSKNRVLYLIDIFDLEGHLEDETLENYRPAE